jgi:hypothetical protein
VGWFWFVGLLALLWLGVRSGLNPKRLSYPCQQAAMPVALHWLVSVVAFAGGSMLLRRCARAPGIVILLVGAVWFTTTWSSDSSARGWSNPLLPTWQVPDPVSTVFVVDNVPPTTGSLAAGDASVPDAYLSDPAIDTLLSMLEGRGTFLHQTPLHPDGIVPMNAIVVIKGNFQWTSRNTTSTDRIKGLVWQILQHPDGFTGEILVCDNTQDIGTGINDSDNNSEDPEQSIVDVASTFYAKGHPVYTLDWNYIWSVVAKEYAAGDYRDGYVFESQTNVSYPKFRSPSGDEFISLRHGVWDSTAASYDASRLCIIDFPVLKAHSWAGATIAVKNWIGTMTTAYAGARYNSWNDMHVYYLFSSYALVARIMAETFPRLTIVDAAWTTLDGPRNLYDVENTRILIASTDPVASSWYAAKYVLTPIALSSGQTDPDSETGTYGRCLSNWTTYLSDSAGYPCTKDSSEISVYDRGILVGNREEESAPRDFRLQQNYPNPFNPSTTIRFWVSRTTHVTIKIFDILGEEVETLVDERLGPGSYSRVWNAGGQAGGAYLCRLQAGELTAARKLLLLK